MKFNAANKQIIFLETISSAQFPQKNYESVLHCKIKLNFSE